MVLMEISCKAKEEEITDSFDEDVITLNHDNIVQRKEKQIG